MKPIITNEFKTNDVNSIDTTPVKEAEAVICSRGKDRCMVMRMDEMYNRVRL